MSIKRMMLRIAVGVVLFAMVAGGWWCLRAHQGLAKAEQLVELGLWPGVRLQVTRYLALYPGDDRARLLLAEAWVKDNSLDSAEAAAAALAELNRIPDSSDTASEARTQAGRLEFLILGRPESAEKLFRRAIQLDVNAQPARYLLWKVLDQTERWHLAAPVFWELYERTPLDERVVKLREWYMSQLFPGTANADLDRVMGFLEIGEAASTGSEGRRLAYFKNADPNSPVAYAALARWFQKQGDVPYASKVLQEAEEKLADPSSNPFYVAMRVTVLLDLGEFEQAQAAFDLWPQPHDGYEYFRCRALLLDEIESDFEQAIKYYQKALALWPGPFEWRLQNRLANCLTRVGRPSKADAARERARLIEVNMEGNVHTRLRQALADLEDPTDLGELLSFYKDLDCKREVDAWKEVLSRLGAGHAAVDTAIQ